MPISPYIRRLRDKVGHDMLFIPAVTAIILDDHSRVLLQRARGDGNWYTIGGAIEPGEQPADACVREVLEETGLQIVADRVVGVQTSPLVTYPNNDQIHYVTIAFLCNVTGGRLHIADDESLDLRYFALDDLPELPSYQSRLLRQALKSGQTTFFESSGGAL